MPEKCETCGAVDRNDCRYRGEDVGCDHPAVAKEMEEIFGAWLRHGETKFATSK